MQGESIQTLPSRDKCPVWCNLEHCVLLHGYDKENDLVYVCDPLNGDVTYSMERYFQIYEDMHKRAMTIY